MKEQRCERVIELTDSEYIAFTNTLKVSRFIDSIEDDCSNLLTLTTNNRWIKTPFKDKGDLIGFMSSVKPSELDEVLKDFKVVDSSKQELKTSNRKAVIKTLNKEFEAMSAKLDQLIKEDKLAKE